jgi:hypothetical protein
VRGERKKWEESEKRGRVREKRQWEERSEGRDRRGRYSVRDIEKREIQ